jgi:CBS domain containing-hemolysin-like protein
MLELILAVALAVGVSAFCSVSEAVFYTFSWSRIEQLRRQGKKSGEVLYNLRRDVDKPISAILTLNTVAHTVGAAIAGAAWATVFGHDSLVWFSLVFTAVILLFSEILPKTFGVVYNQQLAPLLSKPLWLLVQALTPIIWVCGWMARLVSRGKSEPETTEEDIRALVSLTRKAGVIKPYEEMSIRNILSLDQKTVEEIMTPRTVVFTLPAALSVAEARRLHSAWPHSRIPVYEGEDPEDLVGVVFRRKVFEALANDQDELRLADIMAPVKFVPENLSLDKLLVKLLGTRIHFYVVLDEYGGVAGVVTLEDVLEEILGREIVDDTDQVVDMREFARKQREALISAMGGESRGEPGPSAGEQ